MVVVVVQVIGTRGKKSLATFMPPAWRRLKRFMDSFVSTHRSHPLVQVLGFQNETSAQESILHEQAAAINAVEEPKPTKVNQYLIFAPGRHRRQNQSLKLLSV
jgi:hypothetical protein